MAVGWEDCVGRGRRGWRGVGREHLSGRETGTRRRRLGEILSFLRPLWYRTMIIPELSRSLNLDCV